MIRLTRLNQTCLVLNADLIEHVEMTPDTVISLTTGQKLMVQETSDEVVDRVIQYRRAILCGMPSFSGSRPALKEVIADSERSERLPSDGK